MDTNSNNSTIGCTKRGSLGDLLWAPIALFLAASLLAFYRCDFAHVDLEWPLIGASVAVALISRAIRIVPIRLAINSFAQNVVIVFSATIMTYSAATIGRPLIDHQLLRVDQCIGYNWRAYAGFVAHHPSIASMMQFSYGFIFFMPLIVIVSLSATRRVHALEKFILAGLLSLVLTTSLFALFPATTAWAYLQLSDREVSAFHYLTLASEGWIGVLTDIRQAGAASVQTLSGNGLVAFPSFHCTAALLFVWSTWKIIWLRGPMVLMSLALLAATPIFGGHYVSDIIAGAVVMVVSVRIVEWLYGLTLNLEMPTALAGSAN